MNKTRPRILLAFLNLAALAATVYVNYLSVARPFNGKTTGELSDFYPNLFVPAGITFSIWGIIYLLLALNVIYQFVYSLRKETADDSFMERIGILFFLTCLFNAGWVVVWSYEQVKLSLGIMLLLLVTLAVAYLRLGIGRGSASGADKAFVHLPYSVYFGWISVATIANAAAFLVSVKWDRLGLPESFWAVAMIAVAVLLALLMLFFRRDIFYALVVDWALYGILMKRSTDHAAGSQTVVWATYAGLAVVTLCIIAQVIRGKIYRA